MLRRVHPGTRCMVPGTRYLVPGAWYLVLGTGKLIKLAGAGLGQVQLIVAPAPENPKFAKLRNKKSENTPSQQS